MAKQGKMNSSPFHVETVQYKEAIEQTEHTTPSTSHCAFCKNDYKCHNICSDFYMQQCQYFKCDSYTQKDIKSVSSYRVLYYDFNAPKSRVIYCHPDEKTVQFEPEDQTKATEQVVSLIESYVKNVKRKTPEDIIAFLLDAIQEEVKKANESLECLALSNMSHAIDTLYHGKYIFEFKKNGTDNAYAKLIYDPGVLNNLSVFFPENQIDSLIEQYNVYAARRAHTVTTTKLRELTQDVINTAYRTHGDWNEKKAISVTTRDVNDILYLCGGDPFFIKKVNISKTGFMNVLSRIIMINYNRKT